MDTKWGTRAGVAAFALGLSLAGPSALNLGLGVAGAETGDDSAESSNSAGARPARAASAAGDPRATARQARPDRPRSAAASPPAPAQPAAASPPAPVQPAVASRSAATTVGPRSAAAGQPGRERGSAGPGTATGTDRSASQRTSAVAVPAVDVAGRVAESAVAASPAHTAAVTPAAPADPPTVPPTVIAAAAPPATPIAAAALPSQTLDGAGTDWLTGGLPANPVADFVSGALLLARRTVPRAAAGAVAAQPAAVTVVDPNQHVLLIGVDGTNLSAILADPYNQAFFDLMDTGTTAAATMVGHTTISNPGWTGILTGVWSETAGVSNNVFTPWTYDTWPTVFNQLEAADPTIATTAIGNWSVIAQIAGAGSLPADTIVYYPEINGSWIETDDAVGARSIEAIQNTVAGVPSFQMTYFVGVDETGHDTGGSGTPEYAEALRNVNDNIADIMSAVDAWETANPGEEWTVIVVTDHGQVPEAPLGLGLLAHGFQSPPETTVFVIADGPDFRDGAINNTYSQVDVTPTVLSLFGVAPEPYFAGVPLMDRADSDYVPALPGQEALQNALSDAIGMYGYPDILTDITLTLRTIVATVPYFIYTVFTDLSTAVPEFLQLPILAIGAVIYNLVNIPVQLLVKLTGVTGNDILPPQWWPYNPVPGTQPVAPAATLPAAAVAV